MRDKNQKADHGYNYKQINLIPHFLQKYLKISLTILMDEIQIKYQDFAKFSEPILTKYIKL